MEKRTPYIYCICRIDRKHYTTINEELKELGYKNIKAIIPTIHLLRRSRKGVNTYEEVPLLFNYGFIKMRTFRGYDRNFLNKLKKDITGIGSWLKSPEHLHNKKIRMRVDNAEDFDDFSIVATVKRSDVKRYQKISKANQIYSVSDIAKISLGEYVVLRGYPFEGISAVVNDINFTSKLVTVTIYPEKGSMTLQIALENVLYSIYQNYDEDKLYAAVGEYNMGQIPEDSPNQLMDTKQY